MRCQKETPANAGYHIRAAGTGGDPPFCLLTMMSEIDIKASVRRFLMAAGIRPDHEEGQRA